MTVCKSDRSRFSFHAVSDENIRYREMIETMQPFPAYQDVYRCVVVSITSPSAALQLDQNSVMTLVVRRPVQGVNFTHWDDTVLEAYKTHFKLSKVQFQTKVY